MARFYNNIRCIILSLLACVALVSCDNSDDIGDLYGMWKLEEVTYNGTTENPGNLFLCFQSQYVDARYVAGHGSSNAFGYYTNAAGEMSMVYYYREGDPDTSNPNDPNNPAVFLGYFHFHDNGTPLTEEEKNLQIAPVHLKFKVETYTSSSLVLSTNEGRWVFRKY